MPEYDNNNRGVLFKNIIYQERRHSTKSKYTNGFTRYTILVCPSPVESY